MGGTVKTQDQLNAEIAILWPDNISGDIVPVNTRQTLLDMVATLFSVAAGVTEVDTGTGLTGGPITGTGSIALANTSVVPGAYTTTNLTVNQQGQIIMAASGTAGAGVTQVATGTGLTGGPITTTGTISLANTSVTPGAYTNPNLTVNQQGQIITIVSGTVGSVTQVATGTGLVGGPITTTGTISLANTSVVPGAYTNPNLTVNQQGQIITIVSGTVGGSGAVITSIPNVISAGVYGTSGALVRTLWAGRPQTLSAASWDGLQDDGSIASTGTYTLKGLTGNVSYTWDGVIGNSNYSSISSPTQDPRMFQSQDQIYSMAIPASGPAVGTMYLAAGYNEARVGTLKALVASPQAFTYISYKGFHNTGPVVTFVATDGNIVYWAGSDFNTGGGSGFPTDTGVYGTLCSNDTLVPIGTFTSGVNVTWPGGTYTVIDRYNAAEGTNRDNFITGLAVQQSGNWLFTTRKALNSVHILRKDTGAAGTPSFLSLTGAAACCIDSADTSVWIINGTQASKYSINAGTGALTVGGSITGLVAPIAITCVGSTVLIVDGGSSQQIKAFDHTTFAQLSGGTLGTAGGYVSSPAVTNFKYMFRNPQGISNLAPTSGRANNFLVLSYIAFNPADSSFWFGDPGNCRSMHFTLGSPLSASSYVEQIAFLGSNYSCTVPLNNATRVFASILEFSIDYTKTFNSVPGSAWTLVRNWGYGQTDYTYDWLFGGFGSMIEMNGTTYGFLSQQTTPFPYTMVELNSTSGLRFTPNIFSQPGYVFRPNGDVIYPSKFGNVGDHPTWTTYSLTGFSGANPQYGSPVVTTTLAAGLTATDPRNQCFKSDGLATTGGVLAIYDGRVDGNGPPYQHGWHLGGVDQTTGNWVFRVAPTPASMFNYDSYESFGSWPLDGYWQAAIVVNAGGSVLVADSNILYQYYGEGWTSLFSSPESNKWRHYHESGLLVGEFGVTCSNYQASGSVNPSNGNDQVAIAGNAFCGNFNILNGVGYVHHGDEGFKSGIHQWRINGLSTIKLNTLPSLSWNSSNYVAPATNPQDLLAGLQRSVLFNGSISGTTLTVTDEPTIGPSPSVGSPGKKLLVGQTIKTVRSSDAQVSVNTIIQSQLTGPTGGVGTYQVNNSQTVAGPVLMQTATVVSGTAGWTCSPSTENTTDEITNWWAVRTNHTVYSSGDVYGGFAQLSPDINAAFAVPPSTPKDASIVRTLPSVGSQSWTLNSVLQFSGGPGDTNSWVHVEIADAYGRLIVQLVLKPLSVDINTQNYVPVSADTIVFRDVIKPSNPFIVQYIAPVGTIGVQPPDPNSGKLNVTYAGVTHQLSIADALANAVAPATFAVRFHIEGATFNTLLAVNVGELLLQ